MAWLALAWQGVARQGVAWAVNSLKHLLGAWGCDQHPGVAWLGRAWLGEVRQAMGCECSGSDRLRSFPVRLHQGVVPPGKARWGTARRGRAWAVNSVKHLLSRVLGEGYRGMPLFTLAASSAATQNPTARHSAAMEGTMSERVTFTSPKHEGHVLEGDAIFHEGHWWLVLSWLEDQYTRQRRPELLVRPVQASAGPVDQGWFRATPEVPTSVLDGIPTPGWMVAGGPALAGSPAP